jgi:mannan endo-1,4-beta-mannosidase
MAAMKGPDAIEVVLCAACAALPAAGCSPAGPVRGASSVVASRVAAAPPGFVSATPSGLRLGQAPYHSVGVNYWPAMNLGSRGAGGDRARLARDLDRLRALGVTDLRILGGSEGPDEPYRALPALQSSPGVYDEALLEGLDWALAEIGRRGMRAIVVLGNFWFWSGGFAQYVAWAEGGRVPHWLAPGGSFAAYVETAARFYGLPRAVEAFERHVEAIASRRNLSSGIAYRDDPTILAWEIANEPRGIDRPEAMRRFLDRTARRLKELDPYHLVTTGSEGETASARLAGNDFLLDHASPAIDFATVHVWPQNWGWYDPAKPDGLRPAIARALAYVDHHLALAERLGKPVLVEEYGLARDGGSFASTAPTTARDAFFGALFDWAEHAIAAGRPLIGTAPWAYSGEARPPHPGGTWHTGDPWLGDPPHEEQGWYGIYDADTSTLDRWQQHAQRLRARRP